jgi:hypothetical protein
MATENDNMDHETTRRVILTDTLMSVASKMVSEDAEFQMSSNAKDID